MKKVLLAIILSSIFIQNTFAAAGSQALSGWGDIPNEKPKISKSKVAKGAVAFLTPKKVIKLAGILAIAGVAWKANDLRKNPKEVERYLEGHPEHIPQVVAMVSQYEWGQAYLNKIGVGKIYADMQDDLENSQVWIDASEIIQREVVDVAEEYISLSDPTNDMSCKNPVTRNERWNSLLLSPREFKATTGAQITRGLYIDQNGTINNGEYVRKGGVIELDVNKYSILEDLSTKGDNLDLDHVPSKAAIRNFIERKLNTKLSSTQYRYLEANTTAIALNNAMHADGRTYKTKNNADQIDSDSTKLAWATLADLTNHLVHLLQRNTSHRDKQQADIRQFFLSSGMLYARNKALCLYAN